LRITHKKHRINEQHDKKNQKRRMRRLRSGENAI